MNRYLPITAMLKLLPDAIHTEMVACVANQLIRGQVIEHQLGYLEGKHICLSIPDTGVTLHFRVTQQRLRRCSAHLPWDVRIRGDLSAFWRLANRQEDPDTLFFNRKLELEGDTDAALYIKNLLDAVEFDLDQHLQAVAGDRLAPHLRKMIEHNPLLRRSRGTLPV